MTFRLYKCLYYTYYELLLFLVNWPSLFLTHVCFAPGRSSGVQLNLSGGTSDVIVLASYQTTKRTEADPPSVGPHAALWPAVSEAELSAVMVTSQTVKPP